MFVKTLTNSDCKTFATVSTREGRSSLQYGCNTFICTLSYNFFALQRNYASGKRYFDRFQVLRTRSELLRGSEIF